LTHDIETGCTGLDRNTGLGGKSLLEGRFHESLEEVAGSANALQAEGTSDDWVAGRLGRPHAPKPENDAIATGFIRFDDQESPGFFFSRRGVSRPLQRTGDDTSQASTLVGER